MARSRTRRSLWLFAACAAIATACGQTYAEEPAPPGPNVPDGGDAASADGDLPDAATAEASADASADAKPPPPSAAGVLDESFAQAGTTPTMNGRPYALAVQADGRILLAGYDSDSAKLTVWRFLAGGASDTSFGTSGAYRLDVGLNSTAHAIAVDGSGRIVVGGSVDYLGNGKGQVSMLLRLLPGGTLDTTFASGGRFENDIKTDEDDVIRSIALLGDGRIVAAGFARDAAPNFAVSTFMRLTSNGALDTAFGSSGMLMTSTILGIHALVVDGTTIYGVGGPQNAIGFAMVRLTPAGGVDSTFGTNGRVITPIASYALARTMARGADPAIVVGGAAYVGAGAPQDSRFAVARYRLDGTLDPAFGSGGTSVLASASGPSENVLGLALQADGRVIAAGASDGARVVARFTTAGAADPTFGTGGRFVADGGVTSSGCVAVQADGKIVTALMTSAGTFTLLRLR